jgi:hypothetical protein
MKLLALVKDPKQITRLALVERQDVARLELEKLSIANPLRRKTLMSVFLIR